LPWFNGEDRFSKQSSIEKNISRGSFATPS